MRSLFLLFAFLSTLLQAQEFLDPAVAFKPSVRALDGQTIEVSFDIAKGYYLYRDKIVFKLKEGSASSIATVAAIRSADDRRTALRS